MQRSIFGNLLNYDTDPPRINPADSCPPASITDEQFKNYVRRETVENFMRIFDRKLKDMQDFLDKTIMGLRRKGILKYQGAVELQSVRARRL